MTAQSKHTQTHTDNTIHNTVALLNNLLLGQFIVSTFLSSNHQSSHYKGVF